MKNTITIIDHKFAKVSIEDGDYILIEYKKFCPSEIFREIWVVICKYAIEYGIFKYLSDSRKMGAILLKDQQWIAESIAPQIDKHVDVKQTYMAIITEENLFAKSSANFTIERIRDANPTLQRNVQYFDSLEEAKNWLINVT